MGMGRAQAVVQVVPLRVVMIVVVDLVRAVQMLVMVVVIRMRMTVVVAVAVAVHGAIRMHVLVAVGVGVGMIMGMIVGVVVGVMMLMGVFVPLDPGFAFTATANGTHGFSPCLNNDGPGLAYPGLLLFSIYSTNKSLTRISMPAVAWTR